MPMRVTLKGKASEIICHRTTNVRQAVQHWWFPVSVPEEYSNGIEHPRISQDRSYNEFGKLPLDCVYIQV